MFTIIFDLYVFSNYFLQIYSENFCFSYSFILLFCLFLLTLPHGDGPLPPSPSYMLARSSLSLPHRGSVRAQGPHGAAPLPTIDSDLNLGKQRQ